MPPVCLNTTQFNLTGGSPSGGVYSGTGVSGSQFSPLVTGTGSFLLTYNYTDSHGCSDDDTSVITVHTLPSVTFANLNSVCQNTGPVVLSGGAPAGGTYSGPGVGGGIFYGGIAGPGQHTITYSYTNNNGCTNTDTEDITVHPKPLPDLGPDLIVCANSFAHLSGGSFSSYYWSTGVVSPTINVDTTGRGLGTFNFILIVANSFNCTNRDTISITFDQCNGIESPLSGNNILNVFPNPFTTGVTIYSEEGSDISIYDMKGSLMMERKNVTSVFYYDKELSPGAYIVRAEFNGKSTHKLVIKN